MPIQLEKIVIVNLDSSIQIRIKEIYYLNMMRYRKQSFGFTVFLEEKIISGKNHRC